MNKLLLIGAILLTGCTAIKDPVIQQKSDPSWPDQISTYNSHWQVKVIDGQAFVGMPFDQSQDFMVWMNDIKRYIADDNSMLCYYRSHLNEPRCAQYLPKKEKTTK